MKPEEVIKLIGKGESQEIEFKESLSRDISHEVVAMANSGGGWVIIGVSDKGGIVGCKVDMDKLSSIIQHISPPVKMHIYTIELNGKKLLILRVYDDGALHSIGGVAYIRIGTIKRPLDLHEIGIRLVDTLKTYFDKQVSPVIYEEADEEALNFFFSRLQKVRGRSLSVSDRYRYLRSIGAVIEEEGRRHLSYGGLLFFYDKPEEYISHSGLRVVKMKSSGEPFASREFNGPIWRIIDLVMEYLEREISELEVIIGARRERIRKYPFRAVREAVINALTHRNYAIASDILISIYSDKLVVTSPGSLVPGVDLDDPVHIPRNPVVAQLMYDTGYIEKYGVGILLMRRLADDHPYTQLEFKATPNTFKVILHFSPEKFGLDEIDNRIIRILRTKEASSSDLTDEIGISRQAIVNRLNRLIRLGLVKRYGKGWRTRYSAI